MYKVIEELIKRNEAKRLEITFWSKLFFDFYGEDFWISNVSKPYPSCIHVFSNKTGGEKETKVLQMNNKGQYHAIIYTKTKRVYA